RQSSNIIVIQVVDVDQSQVTPDSHAKETPYKANNSSNTDDSSEPIESNESISAEQVIHESITNNTPEAIVGLFRPFFYGSELYRYIGLLFKAKHRPHSNVRIES